MVLAEKHPDRKLPPCSTLELYNKMPILIPMNIAEDVVGLFAQKPSGSLGPSGTDSEAL